MDALDKCVLRALFQNEGLTPVNPRARTSSAAIARKLGVSEGTVRNRIVRFHETGFVKDVRLIANPNLVGLAEACLLFDVPRETRSEVIERIQLLENVVILAVFHGSLLSPIFRYRGEAALVRQVDLFRRLAKVERIIVGRIPFPECNLRLSESDWAVMRAFHRDPRRACASVARDVRLSTRTVKRKLERLFREGAAFTFPVFDPTKLDGGVMGALIVEYPLEMKGDVDRTVAARFGEHIFNVLHMLPYRKGDLAPCGYNCIVPNISKGTEMLDEVNGLPGVRNARFEVFDEVQIRFVPFEEDLLRGDDLPPPATSL